MIIIWFFWSSTMFSFCCFIGLGSKKPLTTNHFLIVLKLISANPISFTVSVEDKIAIWIIQLFQVFKLKKAFKHLLAVFSKISYVKTKEVIFVGPQIGELLNGDYFSHRLLEKESAAAWLNN